MNTVIQFPKEKLEELMLFLEKNNAETKPISSGKSFRVDGTVISVYSSGKVLLQGRDPIHWEHQIKKEFFFASQEKQSKQMTGSEKKETHSIQYQSNVWPRVGTDESGKGDFFGPLVTSSFLVESPEIERKLIGWGVTDSKKLSNTKVLELAKIIRGLGPNETIRIGPSRYNSLHQKMNNVNKILGWSHARAIENILDKHYSSLVISDQFGDKSIIEEALFSKGKNVQLIQMHKAEQDIAVAAASIIARANFLTAIRDVEQKLQIKIPLGAGEKVIETGIQLARKNGLYFLNEVAKTHFKTYEKIKGSI